MSKETVSVCKQNSAIIATIPALQSAIDRLEIKNNEIDIALQAQIISIKGITRDKLRLKALCVANIVKVSSAVSSYAHSINDAALEDKMRYTASSLMRMREEFLIAVGYNVFTISTTYAAGIVTFGINAAMLAALESAVKDFEAIMLGPKEARDNRKMLTAKLDKLFAEADEIIHKEIDPLIQVLPDIHNDFIQVYRNARTIINYRGRPAPPPAETGFGAIYGTVTNNVDGSPIEDAFVVIGETGFTANTDDDGDFLFEQIPTGIYIIKVTAATYVPEVIENIEVLPDADVTLSIGMNSEEITPTPPVKPV